MSVASVDSRLRETPAAVLFYLVGVFAMGFTIDGGIYSVLGNLYLLRLGFGPEFVGIYNSAGLFVFALLSLPIGAIRRWSSRRLLLLGVILTLAGMIVTPMAQWAPLAWQAAGLLGGRILSLIGLSFFFVHSAPFLLGVTSGDWQNRSLAWQSATLAIAGVGGGLLGGYLPGWIATFLGTTLQDPTPYQYPLFLAAGMLVVTLIAILKTPEPVLETFAPAYDGPDAAAAPAQTAWKGPIRPFLVLIIVVRILQVAAPGAVLTFANVYFDDALHVATSNIGIVTAIGRLVSVPVALLTPWLLARWGGFRLVIGVSLLAVVVTLPLALSDSWVLGGIGYAAASGAGPLRYLAFLVLTLSFVPTRRRSLVAGAGEMAIGLGFAIMSFAGGYLIAAFGYGTLFGISLLLTLLGTILFWLIFQPSRFEALSLRYANSREIASAG
jgi:MFS family permease